MAWDAGSIESRLDVDTSPFRHGLDEAKAEAREFADKRYTTTVDIDTKRSSDELAAVEQRLHSIESSVDRIGRKTGGGGRGGSGGFLSRFAGANIPNPSFMSLGLGAAAPMALPLAGVGLGAGASLLAPTLAGGIGLGAFGAGAKSSITTVQKDVASLTKLTQQYDAATTNKQRAAVLTKEAALWKGLDPAQRGAVKNVQALEGAWKRYQKALEPQSFKALADGAKIGTTGLGLLLPVAKAVGNEVDVLEKGVQRALTQPFWKDFFGQFLTSQAPAAVDALGRVVGNVVTGIAHLAEEFSPLGIDLEQLMIRASGRFERWTQGEGPGKFVAWVQKEGPQVGKTLQALATGVSGIGKGLAPIGAVELKALTPVLNFIGKLGDEHPAVITAVGTALLGVGAGLKAINLAQGAAGMLGKLRTLLGGGGGGGGGVAGKAVDALAGRGSLTDPLYVIVLDKSHSKPGIPGGKTATTAAEEEGAGRASRPIVTRALEKIGLRGVAEATARFAPLVAPGADVLTLASGDQAPLPPLAKRKNPYAQLLAIQDPAGRKDFPSSVYKNGSFTVQSAVNYLASSGDPLKIRELQAAAKLYPQIAAAVKVVESQVGSLSGVVQSATLAAAQKAGIGGVAVGDALNRGVDHQVRTRLAATVGPHFAGSIAQIAKNAATAAAAGGESIGAALDDGVARGIEGHKAHALAAAGKLTSQAVGEMQRAGLISSPSRKTIPIGTALAQGVEVGFTGYASTLLKSFNKATQKVIGGLGTQLNNAANQYRSDLQARSQAGASIASSLMGGASIANAGLSNTGGATVSGFLGGQVTQLTTFRNLINQLKAKKLDPALLQQIVDAGPQQGSILAQQILSGGSISGLNRQERQLTSLTNSIGGTVAGAQYAGTLARDQKALEHVARAIETLTGRQLRLSHGDMQTLAREIATQFAHVFPTLNIGEVDRALGLKIRSHR